MKPGNTLRKLMLGDRAHGSGRGTATALDTLPARQAEQGEDGLPIHEAARRGSEARVRILTEAIAAKEEFAIAARPTPVLFAHAPDHPASSFDGIRIGLSRNQTTYEWGPWLQVVNGQPYRVYLPQQADQVALASGTDPVFPTQGSGPWGSVVLQITELEFSNRFGGSVHVTLAAEEDSGVELADPAKNVYVDLHRWLLHLYVRPTLALFNTGGANANLELPRNTWVELETFELESYKLVNQGLVPGGVADQDLETLIGQAEADARAKLTMLARFVLGFLHETRLPGFNHAGQAVERIIISDGLCEFETRQKSPMVSVRARCHFVGADHLEGPLDDDAELTAEPRLTLYGANDLPFAWAQRRKYIGAGSSTPWLEILRVTPDEAEATTSVGVDVGWREDDPVNDDTGYVVDWLPAQITRQELDDRWQAGQLGRVGPTLVGGGNNKDFDNLHGEEGEDLYIGVEVEFHLIGV
jgi:hypothetical protein